MNEPISMNSINTINSMNTINLNLKLDFDSIESLDKIQQMSVKRRLSNEIIQTDTNLYYVTVEYDEILKLPTLIFTDKINDKNTVNKINSYSFIIPIDYPFRSPQVFVNNIPYLQILEVKCVKTALLIRKMIRDCCLLCKSITCENNWSPALPLTYIIAEIVCFRQYIEDCEKILADKKY